VVWCRFLSNTRRFYPTKPHVPRIRFMWNWGAYIQNMITKPFTWHPPKIKRYFSVSPQSIPGVHNSAPPHIHSHPSCGPAPAGQVKAEEAYLQAGTRLMKCHCICFISAGGLASSLHPLHGPRTTRERKSQWTQTPDRHVLQPITPAHPGALPGGTDPAPDTKHKARSVWTWVFLVVDFQLLQGLVSGGTTMNHELALRGQASCPVIPPAPAWRKGKGHWEPFWVPVDKNSHWDDFIHARDLSTFYELPVWKWMDKCEIKVHLCSLKEMFTAHHCSYITMFIV